MIINNIDAERERTLLSNRNLFKIFLESYLTLKKIICLNVQCLMGGWWGEYSFRCQPVDHSASPTATRVSSLLSCQRHGNGIYVCNKKSKTQPSPLVWDTVLFTLKLCIIFSPHVYTLNQAVRPSPTCKLERNKFTYISFN